MRIAHPDFPLGVEVVELDDDSFDFDSYERILGDRITPSLPVWTINPDHPRRYTYGNVDEPVHDLSSPLCAIVLAKM